MYNSMLLLLFFFLFCFKLLALYFLKMYLCKNFYLYRISKNGKADSTIDCVISWLKCYFASSLDSIKELPPVCPNVFAEKSKCIKKNIYIFRYYS